jgi:Na+/proline symporter
MGDNIDFELILPFAIKNFIPVGLMGILCAGLLSAFMSTFAATVNAAPAYIVNDIYKRFINPNATDKKYVLLSYVSSILMVVIGIAFGFVVESINQIVMWIVSALYGGYATSNLLKWYWWRFNGFGYFWGMMAGIIAALVVPKALPELSALEGFPVILLVSIIGSVLGSLLTQPDEEGVLKKFYAQVRPWGFWKAIHRKVVAENPDFKKNKNFGRDLFNIIIGMIWQVALVATPIYIVIQEETSVITGILIIIISMLILKKTWWNKLEE